MIKKRFIPVCEPFIGAKELNYVTDCIKSGWISSSGKYIEKFENIWASYCGVKYGISVSNGTVALQMAIRCLDLKEGDEVIMPTFTIISCAMALVYNGIKPVLVDSEDRTWNMNVNEIEGKITKKTKAIMVVHIYGHPCKMDKIFELAAKYDLKVIEDAAEAHGAEYKGRKCGGLGDISCFSFYANKIVTTGEGGMVLTDNKDYAERLRYLRNLSFRPERRFYHTELGYNFRLTNIQAAIGLAQIGRIEKSVEKKRQIACSYDKELKNLSCLTLPMEECWAKNVYWMYGIVLNKNSEYNAVDFAIKLAEKGVETRPFFLGMHEQPVFQKMGLFKGESYPVANSIARQGLYLPSGLTLKKEEIKYIAETIKEIIDA